MAKITISLDDELVKRTDNYADKNYMSRSGLISLSLTQYLNSYDIVDAVKEMAFAMCKIADNGVVDEDTQKQLEDFERLSKMLVSSK